MTDGSASPWRRGAYMAVTEALGDDEFVEGLESSEFAMGVKGAGGGGRTTKSTMRAIGRAQYRDSKTVDGFTAHRYTDIGGGRSFRSVRENSEAGAREGCAEHKGQGGRPSKPASWIRNYAKRVGVAS
jgi:hypothetical protein